MTKKKRNTPTKLYHDYGKDENNTTVIILRYMTLRHNGNEKILHDVNIIMD